MKLRRRDRIFPLAVLLFGTVACDHCSCGNCSAVKGDDGQWRWYWADVMLADSTPLTRNGDAWVSSGTAVAANMIGPTMLVTDNFDDVTDNCTIFEGVTIWESFAGVSSVNIQSSMQNAVAVHDGTRYAISGLVAAPAFGAADMMTVTDAADGNLLAEVMAPAPMADPTTHLGEPNGLSTIFRAPSGEYDTVIVFVGGVGPMGGESGVMCGHRPENAGGDDTWDEFELVPSNVISDMEARGITPNFISVAYHNEEISSSIFDEDIAVHAGRMVSVSYSDLLP